MAKSVQITSHSWRFSVYTEVTLITLDWHVWIMWMKCSINFINIYVWALMPQQLHAGILRDHTAVWRVMIMIMGIIIIRFTSIESRDYFQQTTFLANNSQIGFWRKRCNLSKQVFITDKAAFNLDRVFKFLNSHNGTTHLSFTNMNTNIVSVLMFRLASFTIKLLDHTFFRFTWLEMSTEFFWKKSFPFQQNGAQHISIQPKLLWMWSNLHRFLYTRLDTRLSNRCATESRDLTLLDVFQVTRGKILFMPAGVFQTNICIQLPGYDEPAKLVSELMVGILRSYRREVRVG